MICKILFWATKTLMNVLTCLNPLPPSSLPPLPKEKELYMTPIYGKGSRQHMDSERRQHILTRRQLNFNHQSSFSSIGVHFS